MPKSFPFSEAVQVDRTLYLSPQIGFESDTKSLIKGGAHKEALTTLHNIDRVLMAAGSHWNKVVKMTVTLQTDL